jgi:hypothetical protein
MLITSRSYAEYMAMFGLGVDDLPGGVVDVSAGGASFVAECTERGVRALAVDPAYAKPLVELAEAVPAAVDGGHAIIAANADRFGWDFYGDLDGHRRVRERAASRFLTDIGSRPGRYVAGALPRLPLRDRAADLVLCSHLLFTWSETLDEQWHRAALRELIRVARHQVRIFPLVTAGTGAAVVYLDALVAELDQVGVGAEFRQVPYEFQRGADTVLILSRFP